MPDNRFSWNTYPSIHPNTYITSNTVTARDINGDITEIIWGSNPQSPTQDQSIRWGDLIDELRAQGPTGTITGTPWRARVSAERVEEMPSYHAQDFLTVEAFSKLVKNYNTDLPKACYTNHTDARKTATPMTFGNLGEFAIRGKEMPWRIYRVSNRKDYKKSVIGGAERPVWDWRKSADSLRKRIVRWEGPYFRDGLQQPENPQEASGPEVRIQRLLLSACRNRMLASFWNYPEYDTLPQYIHFTHTTGERNQPNTTLRYEDWVNWYNREMYYGKAMYIVPILAE